MKNAGCNECMHFVNSSTKGVFLPDGNVIPSRKRYACKRASRLYDAICGPYLDPGYCEEINRNCECIDFEQKVIKPKKPWWKFWR